MLSNQERQILADIEADLRAADPELARRLKPHGLPPRQGVLGAALFVSGLALILATVAVSLPLAMLGMVLTGVGLTFAALDVARRLVETADAAAVRRASRRE